MRLVSGMLFFSLMIGIIVFIVAVYVIYLLIKTLKKYLKSGPARKEKKIIRKSLSEALRENRLRCKMTQEFVAETIGVSRQAVSKWENGISDPSTSNLIALAKLYKVSPEELLENVINDSNDDEENNK